MLRIIQNTSAAGAKSYYSTADYYTEGQELAGVWRGKGAQRLGLDGKIESADWDALCDNRFPQSGEPLTLRRQANRRVGYDINFHVPKSVSLLYSLSRDDRLLDGFREAVNETMEQMEAEMQTRIRKDGRNEDRTTGNLVWGEFIHFTARPVDGVPDPHLHAHCFAFNATWDQEEGAWKAGQFAGLKRDAPYFEAVFHARLARKYADLGLAIERTKTGWELAGVDRSAIDKFSRRTALIEEEARKKGLLDEKAKSDLGAKTREHKQKDLTLDDLGRVWRERLTDAELAALQTLAERVGGAAQPEDADAGRAAIGRAVEHVFERKSVVPERTLLTESLKRAVGQATVERVEADFHRSDVIIAERAGQRLATTKKVLAEEKRMIGFARSGRGSMRRLGLGKHECKRDWLNADQRRAIEHLLNSRDRVMMIRGSAGVGKTSMMQEAVEAIEGAGTQVFTFAPSADASRGTLRQEGFASAETVAKLLVDEKLQESLAGQLIWIDEAGLLGAPTLAKVFDLAERLDARVILSGDRKQHASVERGSVLALLEAEAGIVPAEIKEIQRQRGDYKEAVKLLAAGKTAEGFAQLDQLGWIEEATDADRYTKLAADYVQAITAGQSTLVVSPTHAEGKRITTAIRDRLQAAGRLGESQSVSTLTSAGFTHAERADAINYGADDVIVFHQNAKGYKKGQRLTVGDRPIPFDQADRFETYHARAIELAPGDLIRFTRNGETLDGKHRLNNGSIYRLAGFTEAGNLLLSNGWEVDRDFGHLTHGYVMTSHASQGKTVDRVFIGQSADSWGAASKEQFYVSVSRARRQATIYTDDKSALRAAVDRTDERLSATELLNISQRERTKAIVRQEQQRHAEQPADRPPRELIFDR